MFQKTCNHDYNLFQLYISYTQKNLHTYQLDNFGNLGITTTWDENGI